MNIAVLITCHNRRETTMRCLRALHAAAQQVKDKGQGRQWNWHLFLVDDGSTDGTGEKIREYADQVKVKGQGQERWEVHLIQGNGKLYWARGMALAWREALKYETSNRHSPNPQSLIPTPFGAFLWLNDDAVLDEDALVRLRDVALLNPDAVHVGALRDSASGTKVYGVMSNGQMTGSFVCVPRSAYSRVGVLCDGYRHAWADCDYSLTCKKAGIPVVEFGVVGSCEWHEARPRLRGMGLRARFRTLVDPKGWCVHDVWLYRRRHFGLVRAVFSSVHLILHVLFAEWGWWRPLYLLMAAMPRMLQRSMWRALRHSGIATLINDEGFCCLQLLGAGGECYVLPAEGGGLNSVITWQRLNWQSLLPRVCSDKLSVRDYVRARCGDDVLNEIYPVDRETLPSAFALKCSTGSGMNFIVRDKAGLDWVRVEKMVTTWLGSEYSRFSRERQYEGAKPKVFAEKLLVSEDGAVPNDYKFMCTDGSVLFCRVDEDRFGNHKRACYSRTGEKLDVKVGYEGDDYPVSDAPLPANWEDMVGVAERLSRGIPLVRIDLYSVRGKTVFGEMTFTSGGGFEGVRPFAFSQQMAKKVRGLK